MLHNKTVEVIKTDIKNILSDFKNQINTLEVIEEISNKITEYFNIKPQKNNLDLMTKLQANYVHENYLYVNERLIDWKKTDANLKLPKDGFYEAKHIGYNFEIYEIEPHGTVKIFEGFITDGIRGISKFFIHIQNGRIFELKEK